MVDSPTVLELKTRYPEFEPVSDERVQLFIDEAVESVDDSWLEADQKRAIMSLACHLISSEGHIGSPDGGPSGYGHTSNGHYLKRRVVGDVTNEWSENSASVAVGHKSSTASQASYNSTPYGVKFLRLLKLNHSGVRAV